MTLSLLLAFQDHAAEAAHAADGHEAGAHLDVMATGNLMPGITALVVFLVALIVLWRGVWPKIAQGLDEREAKILGEIKSAEEARAKAQAAMAEYEASLVNARREASEMIARAKADAKAAAEELRSRNETELAEMKQRARGEIESAKQSAIRELQAHAVDLAATIAGKVLAREVSVDDQQRLVEDSLRELRAANHS